MILHSLSRIFAVFMVLCFVMNQPLTHALPLPESSRPQAMETNQAKLFGLTDDYQDEAIIPPLLSSQRPTGDKWVHLNARFFQLIKSFGLAKKP